MTSLEHKIDALTAQVAELSERQQKRDELFDEMMPILKDAMNVATERLSRLEERGYFAFGRELVGVADKIVEGYTAQDVAALGNSIVNILDAVRALTQPHVVKMVADIGSVVEQAEDQKPAGLMATVRAGREEDVQRGMAVMLEVLRRVGHGADRADRRERLRRQLASRRQQRPAVERVRDARPVPASSSPERPAAAPPTARRPAAHPRIEGVAFSDEGFMLDPQQWTREIAAQIAASIGVSELTERHWALIDFAREQYLTTGMSPNLRRISQGSGVGTKEIYGLFPKAPGKCTAMIAGIPKPVGCI